MTTVLSWDATGLGVTASLIQAQAGLEPGLCASMLVTGYSGPPLSSL